MVAAARRRVHWPRVVILLLGVLAVALVVGNLLRDRAAAPAPLVGLSSVEGLLSDDVVERASLEERAQRLTLVLRPDAAATAQDLVDAFAASTGAFEAATVDADEPRVVAFFPLQFADELTGMLIDAQVPLASAAAPRGRPLWQGLLTQLLPIALILAFVWWLVSRRGNGPQLGGGRGGEVTVPDTTFADVAGLDEAVEDLRAVVTQLTEPERYADLGVRPPKGVLLAGPPGTGKTLLARAVAGQAGVAFFALSGSDFVDTYVGVGARRVRELFDTARRAGRAVVFIDEIDAIGKRRSRGGAPGGGNDESERTLNALLVEMDGFDGGGADGPQIVVLAATNRPELLDDALTRPGRFDRQVTIPAPDRAGRLAILRIHAAGLALGADVDLPMLARRTVGMTGAELANLLNTAAVEAARAGARTVAADHVEEALQTLAMGRARRSAVVTPKDRLVTAWHEGGHAMVALMLDAANDPLSVTIVPRGASGGTTWMDGDDRVFLSRSRALAQLAVAMGGRAGEEVLLDGDVTQGASSDLAQATDLATRMVTEYGMAGTLRVVRPGAPGGRLSDAQQAMVDEAVEGLLADALATARRVLGEHRTAFATLVGWLLDDETVEAERLRGLRRVALAPSLRAPTEPDRADLSVVTDPDVA